MPREDTNRPLRRLDLLASPAFIASLLLLVVNDWIFKSQLHSWLTGKLSDLAGLAAISLFACAFFPTRKSLVAALITVGFIYWKSPYSKPMIDLANSYSPYWIGRTVDYTDLVALPVIWLVCFLAPKMRGPSTRVWMQSPLAAVSLVAFTGTTFINTHLVRETAQLPLPEGKDALARMEKELQGVLDALAANYKLDCSICEPLSTGRLYKDRRLHEGGWPTGLSLMARLDQDKGELLYDIRVADLNRKPSEPERVDALRDTLEKELRARFAALRIERASTPSRDKIDVVAYKRNRFTSYRDAENQRDYERGMALVKEAATKFNLKHSEVFGYHYLGNLLGPNSFDRELVVQVGIADSPLIIVAIYRASERYADLQESLARDIEQRFRAEFGDDRARMRK